MIDTALAAVERFSHAFDTRDIDTIMATMTPDCVFEDTSPPDGRAHVGAAAVRAAWTTLFTASPDGAFTTEEITGAGDRVVARWRYDWGARGTFAASTCSPSATGSSPRSCPTSRADGRTPWTGCLSLPTGWPKVLRILAAVAAARAVAVTSADR